MGNDVDRLQQMEDNFNAGDSIYQALGVQQATMRNLAKEREEDREDKIETIVDILINDEGYSPEQARDEAERMLDEELE